MTDVEWADSWADNMQRPPDEQPEEDPVNEVPGLASPWPNPHRYPITRRLLALWRWEWERGENSEAAYNARRSLENRTAGIGVEVLHG